MPAAIRVIDRLDEMAGDVLVSAPASGHLLRHDGARWVNSDGGSDLFTQYALLAGRSGGQSLKGDTATGGNLTLQSTAHATKGKVLIGASAYDEANDRLGIGTASPGHSLDVLVPAISGREQALRIKVSDAGNDQFGVANVTNTANLFGPAFFGYRDQSSDKAVLSFRGMISSGTDSGAEPVVAIQCMRSSSAADPNNGTFSDVTARPLMAVVDRSGTKKTLIVSPAWYAGFGQATPASLVHTKSFAAADLGLVIEGITSQTGRLLQLRGQSSTTAGRVMAEMDAVWVDSTDSTRKARGLLYAWDTSARECLRWEADGSAAKIGFWGSGAAAKQTLAAYTSDSENSAYTGIDNAQAGTVYAQLADLNTLRSAYETLRTMCDDLRTKLQTTTLVG